ncbi:MAG: hypothetical protein GX774_20525 [Armatimonadetes bacterium]|nr:hypothetical protein [Armatimonadota bacterium]
MSADRLLPLGVYASLPPAECFSPTTAAWLRARLRQIKKGGAGVRPRERQEVCQALRLLRAGCCVQVAHHQGAVYYAVLGREAPLLAVSPTGKELRLADSPVDHWPWSAMPLPKQGLWIGDDTGYQGPLPVARLLRQGFTLHEVDRALALLRSGDSPNRPTGARAGDDPPRRLSS